jgi:outer membrane protein TolC
MIKPNILAFICSLVTVGSAISQTLSIDSCHALAIRNYPLIKQYDLIEKTKEYTLSNAGKSYLPQVSLTAIGGYIFGGIPNTGTGGDGSNFRFIGLAQVNQTIWDGGATKTQKKIIKAQSETDKANLDVALDDLKYRVNQLYFGILLVDEPIEAI